MAKGFDADFNLTHHADCLVNAGFEFVVRYYNTHTASKNLTLAEAQALVKAGLKLGAVWENFDAQHHSPTHASYFDHAIGVHDGTAAYHYAKSVIGQPPNTPIYFAVDYDATSNDVNGVISAYFKGIADGFKTISSGIPAYTIGVYGSGLVCKSLLNSNLVTFTWLSQSTGFNGSKTFKDYNIKQLLEKAVCQIKGDPNETNDGKDPGVFVI